jgi:hypothetical protein
LEENLHNAIPFCSINVALDGFCDHRVIPADEDLHQHTVENLTQADAMQEIGRGLFMGGVMIPMALA